ncbi:MAG: Transposase [Candidatus Woesebacteria bacterium GW2011_GWA1_39_21b]|uniref:Transposase IS200-like domain-containing protein n=3 Tax=Patescibacteria group TaxID=1783273 RepID=A0A1G2QHA1_9BACT|nr:MAG: Transposase [Candidatus Woesebacteria bacterium GW2011_GWA1_39_21b]KKS77219.1 MAG: Transposase [Parcubacteria group bacterium GW2011_GWB1_42_9]KKS89793.1 MAG: Transposase [Parcubacteria group bacterium GW2011_GWC1_43_11b]OHA59361.1 MAG: hypothetical protein A2370_00225 [Candidatus Vogelbacteria bacterium RIFOXYB1_FULL_42_16]OHA60463.1 MAG: hypothetical protein A2607_00120 [Candidatus Vogelbacteria bacterium RIFOXYD1_FULL_42_15]
MGNRKVNFALGEFYHIYNRGIDKRKIFTNEKDLSRFVKSIREFNSLEPIGSLYENSFKKDSLKNEDDKKNKLVNIACYAINPNHFHLILEPLVEKGIEKFMQRLGTGYTMYFNEKYKRSGALFQGVFKSVHINSNEYLVHLSAYINLNDRVHQLGGETSKLVKNSWNEYLTEKKFLIDDNSIILEQFNNLNEYKEFSLNTLSEIIERKNILKEEQEENIYIE